MMKPISLLLTIVTVMVVWPRQFVSAAMVETETVLKTACAQKARNQMMYRCLQAPLGIVQNHTKQT